MVKKYLHITFNNIEYIIFNTKPLRAYEEFRISLITQTEKN